MDNKKEKKSKIISIGSQGKGCAIICKCRGATSHQNVEN